MSELAIVQKIIPDETHMLALGVALAKASPVPCVIFLYGTLGAGKTTLTRGFLQGLGFNGKVKSPTYTLVEPYDFSDFKVFHFDFYRLKDPFELEYMGIQDYFSDNSICLIEWPELGNLSIADLSCYIEMQGESRVIKLVANTEIGQTILERMQK